MLDINIYDLLGVSFLWTVVILIIAVKIKRDDKLKEMTRGKCIYKIEKGD